MFQNRETSIVLNFRIHLGFFGPRLQGVTFKEHTAPVWCVAADRETLVTGDGDGNVFARDFGPTM